jgi:hypothetical protein
MSDYANGKVEGEEAPELAKEILYSQGAFSPPFVSVLPVFPSLLCSPLCMLTSLLTHSRRSRCRLRISRPVRGHEPLRFDQQDRSHRRQGASTSFPLLYLLSFCLSLFSAELITPFNSLKKVFPFEQTQEAYRYLDSGKHFGKVVIELS